MGNKLELSHVKEFLANTSKTTSIMDDSLFHFFDDLEQKFNIQITEELNKMLQQGVIELSETAQLNLINNLCRATLHFTRERKETVFFCLSLIEHCILSFLVSDSSLRSVTLTSVLGFEASSKQPWHLTVFPFNLYFLCVTNSFKLTNLPGLDDAFIKVMYNICLYSKFHRTSSTYLKYLHPWTLFLNSRIVEDSVLQHFFVSLQLSAFKKEEELTVLAQFSKLKTLNSSFLELNAFNTDFSAVHESEFNFSLLKLLKDTDLQPNSTVYLTFLQTSEQFTLVLTRLDCILPEIKAQVKVTLLYLALNYSDVVENLVLKKGVVLSILDNIALDCQEDCYLLTALMGIYNFVIVLKKNAPILANGLAEKVTNKIWLGINRKQLGNDFFMYLKLYFALGEFVKNSKDSLVSLVLTQLDLKKPSLTLGTSSIRALEAIRNQNLSESQKEQLSALIAKTRRKLGIVDNLEQSISTIRLIL